MTAGGSVRSADRFRLEAWPPPAVGSTGRTMNFSLATLWHERNRFLPGVLAVAFSALLITVQFGILLGLLSLTSVPVDLATADLWIGDPQVLSVDVTEAIPEAWLTRVQSQPEVDRVEK